MSKIANFRNEYTEVFPTDVFKVSKNDGTDDKKIAFSDMAKQQTQMIYSNRIVDSYLINDDGDIELTLANPNYNPVIKDGISFRFTLRGLEFDWQWKVNPKISINGSTPKPIYNGYFRIRSGLKNLDRNTLGNGVNEIIYNIDDDAWWHYKIGTESGQFEEDTEDGDKAGSLMFDETIGDFLTANPNDFPIVTHLFGSSFWGLYETVIAGCSADSSTLNKRVAGVIGDFNNGAEVGSFLMYNYDYPVGVQPLYTDTVENSLIINSLAPTSEYYTNYYDSNHTTEYNEWYLELFTDKTKSIKYQTLPSGVHTNTTKTELFTRRLRVFYRYIL